MTETERQDPFYEACEQLAEEEARRDPPLSERQRVALQALLYPREPRRQREG